MDIIGQKCVTMCYQFPPKCVTTFQLTSPKRCYYEERHRDCHLRQKENVNTTWQRKVEVRIYLSRTERKYITLGEATPEEWEQYEREDKFADIRKRFEDILAAMEVLGKDMTIASFNVCAGL